MHLLINHYAETILQQGDFSAVWERGLDQLSNGAVSGHFTLSITCQVSVITREPYLRPRGPTA